MAFMLLLTLKTLLFMNITKIQYNGLLAFCISILIILFVYTLIGLSPGKIKWYLGLGFYVIVSIIMFVDTMYFSYFNRLPSITMLKMLGLLGATGDSIKDLLSIKHALFLLDLPLALIYFIYKQKQSTDYEKRIRWWVPCSILSVIIIILSYLSSIQLFGPVTNQELFTYHAKDIKKAIIKDDMWTAYAVFNQDDLEDLKERTKLKEGKYTGIGQGKNLIVIQVEALQNFVVNLNYEGQEITPNINKLIAANGSLYFNNFYQLISKGNTSDAEFITNNSLYPSSEDPTYMQYENNAFYGLPWILRDYGYNSWVFHGYEKEFWNRERAYPNQGFQRFISEEDYDIVESIGFGITDQQFYKQSMDYIKELNSIDDNPFYAFVISLSSHTPFNIPDEYRYLNIREEHQKTILGDYLQSIHYADKAIGEFLEYLKEEGIYEDSVIALYGDHFAISSFNSNHKELMTDFLGEPYDIDRMFNIPLVVHIPGQTINETIPKVGSQLDFLPTILNIMGYENKKGIMMGKDLVNFEGYNFVAPQYYTPKGSFVDDKNIFIMSKDSIFENCAARDRRTKEEIEVDALRDKYEMIIAEINKSDYIIKRNLIKYMLEDDGDVDLSQLASKDIPNSKYIANCYTNPINELNRYYRKGYRMLAVTLEWGKDDEEVLIKNNSSNEAQLCIDELIQWMADHPLAYILLRTEEKGTEIFLTVKDKYSNLKDRFVVEMKEFRDYVHLTHKAYKNVFLNVVETDYTEGQIMDFVDRNHIAGIIMDKDLANTELPQTFKGKDMLTYVESPNKFSLRCLTP